MKFVLCSDNPLFNNNQLQSAKWCTRFPGSGWISCLYANAQLHNFEVVTGESAIEHVTNGAWRADELLVISDMGSKDAKKLVNLGAVPFLMYCLEAPLYAPFFYDAVDILAKTYRYKWVFSSCGSHMNQAYPFGIIPLKFPSYFVSDIQEIHNWKNRRFITYIAENKYRSAKLFIPSSLNLKDFLRQFKYGVMQAISPSYRLAVRGSLHEKRLEAIEYFMANQDLDLYGSGWDDLGNLPIQWSRRLARLLKNRYFGRCESKLQTLSQYRFSLCYENIRSPGYMTEKIIDCFVAGTIPVYFGNPNVLNDVPRGAFVDARNFSSMRELDLFLQAIDEKKAQLMIHEGRIYLQSKEGLLHSYEMFAKNIIELSQLR